MLEYSLEYAVDRVDFKFCCSFGMSQVKCLLQSHFLEIMKFGVYIAGVSVKLQNVENFSHNLCSGFQFL